MHARKNVAENVPRCSFFVIDASVSAKPCCSRRSDRSTYVIPVSFSFFFRKVLTRSSYSAFDLSNPIETPVYFQPSNGLVPPGLHRNSTDCSILLGKKMKKRGFS